MTYVTKRQSFSASHRLYNPDLSNSENTKIFGNCSNPNGHGHNYVLEVTVVGIPNPQTGYVIDLKELKRIIHNEIISKVDHKHLNLDVEFLKGIVPTAENMVYQFWKILSPKITSGKLHAIRLYETDNNFVEYRGETQS